MAPNGTADLVFVNGRVATMDAARRWAGAVAVAQGQIVAVGTDADVADLIGLGDRGRGSRRQDAPARVPGRARPPTVERLRDAALQPVRGLRRRGVRADRVRVRVGAPGRPVGRRRRVVDGRLPGRQPAEGDPGPRGAGSAGVPDEPGRSQRVGELARARDRGRDARHARPAGRVDRPRRRRANPRGPCTRAPSSSSSGTSPSRRRRIGSKGSSPRSVTCMRSGSRRGRTRSSAAATRPSTPTGRSPPPGSSPRGSWARCGGTGTGGSSRSRTWSTRESGARSGGSRPRRSRSCRTA